MDHNGLVIAIMLILLGIIYSAIILRKHTPQAIWETRLIDLTDAELAKLRIRLNEREFNWILSKRTAALMRLEQSFGISRDETTVHESIISFYRDAWRKW